MGGKIISERREPFALKQPRKMSDVEFLEKLIDRMKDPKRWVQGINQEKPHSPKMCVVGHANVLLWGTPLPPLNREYPEDTAPDFGDQSTQVRLNALTTETWDKPRCGSFQEWQDGDEVTHEMVMKALYEALDRARKVAA